MRAKEGYNMGKLFYIMGKSASGKDTLFKILKEHFPDMKTITMYTTRPIRENEADGEEYYFVTRERRREPEEEGKVIECRTYQTIAGPWDYFTVDDGQIDFEKDSYLIPGHWSRMKNFVLILVRRRCARFILIWMKGFA